MSKTFYDVYIGERNRTYLVAPNGFYGRLLKAAKKRFKKARSQIEIRAAYVNGDNLYFEIPEGMRGTKCGWVAYIKHDIRRTTYGD